MPLDAGLEGIVYTFYSYKGGAGRSMAVANTAALLAKWGHSVLVVDWDLEAPGIERFFVKPASEAARVAASKPGIVDLIAAKASGENVCWQDCVHSFRLSGSSSPVSVISAGRRSPDYVERMQRLDFPFLFETMKLGAYIEELRAEWVSSFEFILIDSRTGVTDIGSICTVHLADVLILVFTSTDSSVEGGLEIVRRARDASNLLPLDRGRLLVVPLPSRDESRTEYELAAEWKRIFAAKFESLYRDWLPSGIPVEDAIETLKVPYVPYWSFGERTPALEESATGPASLAYAYEILGRLLASRLDWSKALNGSGSLPPPPRAERHSLDEAWARQQFAIAEPGIASVHKTGFVEIYHCCADSPIDRLQDELVAAARQAVVHTLGWPLGAVLDTGDARPRPNNEGVAASIKREARGGRYEYWALTRRGDFYGLMSLPEDETPGTSIAYDTRVIRATEALLHCGSLYRSLGTDTRATIQFRVRYGGLRGRTLTSASGMTFPSVNEYEDETISQIEFRLDQLDANITQLVRKLCSGLFMLFDFFNPPESTYQKLVSDFVAGKISPI